MQPLYNLGVGHELRVLVEHDVSDVEHGYPPPEVRRQRQRDKL